MSLSDSELLQHYATNRCERAFGEFVRRHAGMVMGVTARRLGAGPYAEDAAQTVFALAARKAGNLARHPHPGAWLHRAAVLESLKAARREATHQRTLDRYRQEQNTMKRTFDEDKERQDFSSLDEAMEELPFDDRRLLLWRYFEDRSYGEIAGLAGISEVSARQRLSRALKRLAARLQGRGVAVPVAAVASQLVAVGSSEAASISVSVSELTAAALRRAEQLSRLSILNKTLVMITWQKPRIVGVAALAAAFVGTSTVGFVSGRQAADYRLALMRWEQDRPLIAEARLASIASENNHRAGSGLSVEELVRQAAAYFADPSVMGNRERGLLTLHRIRVSEVASALALVQSADELKEGTKTEMAIELMALLATSDPAAALTLAADRLPEPKQGHALFRIVDSWSDHDPMAAWKWHGETATGLPVLNTETKRGMVTVIFESWGAGDAAEALATAFAADTAWSYNALHAVASQARHQSSRDAVLAAVAAAPDHLAGHEARRYTLQALAREDPPAAAAWLATLTFPSTQEHFNAIGTVAEKWLTEDRTAALSWLASGVPGELRSAILRELALAEPVEKGGDR